MRIRIQNILFFIALLGLFIPIGVQYTPMHQFISPLNGVFNKTDTLTFSIEKWTNKSWQSNRSLVLKNNLKIKPAVVRLGHEMDFRLFNEFHMADLLIGKDGFLFSESWAKARNSQSTFNQDSLTVFIEKLAYLQKLLKQRDKYFKLIIPPSKEALFAEKLPAALENESPDSDYLVLSKGLKKHAVNYWDLKDFYQNAVDTSTYPIYSKTSVHWTSYGAHFTLLKLLKDMNRFFDNKMAVLKTKKFNTSLFKAGDGDHETTLNLLSRIDNQPFAYPNYMVDSTNKNQFKPKVITIGDSYYWALKGCWMLPYIYTKDSKYLYYFSKVHYNNSFQEAHSLSSLDLIEELKSSDALIIINSSHNLSGFPYGFENYIDAFINALEQP